MSYDYSYDANGNITEIKQNGKLTNKYVYDSLNELKEEYDYVNKFYINYSYDGAGNLQNKYEQVLDPNYGYPTGTQNGNTYEYTDTSWKDKLTKVNGSNISYDANGNPLTYRDGMSFSWENGRNLKTVRMQNDSFINMKYDINGMRTLKSSENRDVRYFYDSKSVMTGLSYEGNAVYFYYDTDGTPTAMSFDDTMYYYIKNLQGDIVKIVNQDGNTVVTYTYDALGKITKQTDTTTYGIAKLNPFRYRGYVYDDETGLYYLQSRYYDPVTGRFINADVYCDTNTDIFGTNMFTYCNNDPINQVDPEGTDAYWLQFENAVGWVINNYSGGYYDGGYTTYYAGHTSLLLQDSLRNWWYFYWGPKHVILRPCGKDDFSLSELNSYLTGFDPRPNYNYYVYATNVISDNEDVGYRVGYDKYYIKNHDGIVTNWLYMMGNFTKSYEYACSLVNNMYWNSNANQLKEYVYENGKPIFVYNVCSKKYDKNVGLYYLEDLNSTDKNIIKSYHGLEYNCVQVSMEVLLKGTYYGSYQVYYNEIYRLRKKCIPNDVYYKLRRI